MAGYGEFSGPVHGQPGNVGTSVPPTAGDNEANVPMDKRVCVSVQGNQGRHGGRSTARPLR